MRLVHDILDYNCATALVYTLKFHDFLDNVSFDS